MAEHSPNIFASEEKPPPYTNSYFTFSARISPQWPSELRRLWPNFPRQVACELDSGYTHYAWTAA